MRKLHKLSLLWRFGILSALTVLLLGLVLGRSLQTLIKARAIASAREEAVLVSRVGIQAHLSPPELTHSIGMQHLMMLDDAVKAKDVFGKDLESFTIWNRALDIVYSSNARLIDPMSAARPAGPLDAETSGALRAALDGKVGTRVMPPGMGMERMRGTHPPDKHLDVYVPIRFESAKPPAGVFKISMPYAPIARAIANDTRWLYLILASGLALMYALLFRIVSKASRTLRRQAEENEHQALHDALTDLPNRTLFRDRVLQAVRAGKRDGVKVALMLIDLDRFKEINDTLGHHNGDLFLQQIGPRLRGALRDVDSVARLGGDEFGILLPSVADAPTARLVAEKIRAVLEEPFTLNDLTLSVEASVGISVFPDHGEDVDTLIQRADVAMYLAKETHSGSEVYSPDRDQYTPRRLTMLGELRRGIEDGQLVLHYQPEADLRTGAVNGVEVLVRWQHPEHGLIYPDEFIPLAEHTGLILPLTKYVLDGALEQCRRWREEGIALTVSVNLSVRNLLDAELPDMVERLLAKWDLEPASLRLELTENTIMADPKRAWSVLDRLREIGVGLAIDDFGTGYSSLSYLNRLPVDELKIDKSFVMNMAANENDAVIVRSTVDLSRNLGLKVVAEGVETEEVWQALAALGCDLAQGYYLTKPIPADALTAWFHETEVAPTKAETRKEGAAGIKLFSPRVQPSTAS